MLNRLKSLLNPPRKKHKKSGDKNAIQKVVIEQKDHKIPEKLISHAALRVMAKLNQEGFQGYLVGGGVRDLLLGGEPKDFDVATDATPEQVRRLFRNSRIIGKRFQIVHVRFGRELIEVTTFRANHNEADKTGKKNQALESDKGVLLRDNVYGDLESDAIRRDFSINALYYDSSTKNILDFTRGMEDLEARRLQIIGDPEKRYKEDPVRMLRAVRFACKLGFHLEAETEKNIHDHSEYLSEIPAARLFEEVLKLFMSGSALATLNMLQEFKLLEHLFPGLTHQLDTRNNLVTNERTHRFVTQAATNTDKRVRQGKSVTPAFIYASFLWPSLQAEMDRLSQETKISPNDAFYQASQGVISQQLAVTSIPKRFLIPMREIWVLQSRLEKRGGNKAEQMLENPRFRAAYDFLLLREESGEDLNKLGEWWTRYQFANPEEKQTMLQALAPEKKPRKRRRKKTNKQKQGDDKQASNDKHAPDGKD